MLVTIAANTFILVKLLLAITAIFIFIPLLISKPSSKNTVEDILKGFCASIFSGIIITYCLVITGLYDFLTLFILFIPINILVIYWLEGKRVSLVQIKDRFYNLQLKIFNVIEKKDFSIWREIKNLGHLFIVFFKNRLRIGNYGNASLLKSGGFLTKGKVFAFMLIFVIGYSLCIRLAEVMPHTSLYYSDSYGHLMIVKQYLTEKIMSEKFYPLGYHSIITDIKMFSGTDFVDIIRLLGPIQTTILIASAFSVIYLITGNKYTALFGSAVLGMDSLDIWPLVFYRQIVALPQEFGTIFILPAVYFCIEYIATKKDADLKYFFICLANIFLIHFYVGILLLWLMIGVLAGALVYRLWTRRTFMRTILAGLSGCMVGAVPFLIWALTGWIFGLPNRHGEILPDGGFLFRYINLNVSFQDYFNFIFDSLNPDKDIIKWHNPLSANLIIYSLLLSFLYLIIRGVFCRKFPKKAAYLLAFSIGQLFLVLFYYGFKYNLIAIMYFERIGLALSICGVVITAILLSEGSHLLLIIIRKFKRANLLRVASAVGISSVYLVILMFCVTFPYDRIKPEIYQYEGVLKAYAKIKNRCELLDWTVVSPVEELSVVYGYGFHYEMWKFLKDFDLKDARNRSFDFGKRLPSRNIFIILEKEPLLVWYTIPSTVYQISETERYYRMYHGRNYLEKQIAVWIKEYHKSHLGMKNDTKIFYEDEDIIVYHLVHDVKKAK